MRFEKKKTNLDSIEAYACICMAAVCSCICTCGCGCTTESLYQTAFDNGFTKGWNSPAETNYFSTNPALAIQTSS